MRLARRHSPALGPRCTVCWLARDCFPCTTPHPGASTLRHFGTFRRIIGPSFTCNYYVPHLFDSDPRRIARSTNHRHVAENIALATKKYSCFSALRAWICTFSRLDGVSHRGKGSGGFPQVPGGSDHTLSDWVLCIASAGQKRWMVSLAQGLVWSFFSFFILFDDDDGHADMMGSSLLRSDAVSSFTLFFHEPLDVLIHGTKGI